MKRLSRALIGTLAACLALSASAQEIVVTTNADSGPGSLREAIATAAARPGTDRIVFAEAAQNRIVLESGLTIAGQELEIDATSVSDGLTLTSNFAGAMFTVEASARLKLTKLTVFRANGAIFCAGALDLTDCLIDSCYGDSAVTFAGTGSSTITRCLFRQNSAQSGGALSAIGRGGFTGSPGPSVSLVNCEFFANSAAEGGAIFCYGGVSLFHCTLSRNVASSQGGAIVSGGLQGADLPYGNVGLQNCVVAENFAPMGPDLYNQGGMGFENGGATNLIGNNESVSNFYPRGPLVGTPNAPLDPQLIVLSAINGFGIFPEPGSPAIDAAATSSLTTDSRNRPRPVGSGPDLGAIEIGSPDIARARLGNVSTRLRTAPGDAVAIAGFSIQGTERRVAVRALGPSLTAAGISGPLANPNFEVKNASGTTVGSNDDWESDAASALLLRSRGLGLTNPLESGLVLTLPAGNYTVIVRGAGDSAGVSVAEVYDLGPGSGKVVNLSTRGPVGTDQNVMIGGFVVGVGVTKRVLIRALGPSLTDFGVSGVLQDTTLEIRDAETLLGTNDDWQSGSQAAAIQATNLAPGNARESAIILTLPPGSYSAIVRGKNGTSGNAIVEVYELE